MRTSARLGMAEPEILGLDRVVRAGDTVFDIGAAYGMYTVPLARLVGPTGAVHSFEPQRRQFHTVRAVRSLIGGDHVTVTNAAVGADENRHTVLVPIRFGVPIYGHAHVSDGTEAALTPQSKRARCVDTVMHTVDAWVRDHSIPRVSFLKVDVEGFEPVVVEGAAATIDRDRPSLLLEIEDRHLGRYGRSADGFVADVLARWPEYRMCVWRDGAWMPAAEVTLERRNYLFATDDAWV